MHCSDQIKRKNETYVPCQKKLVVVLKQLRQNLNNVPSGFVLMLLHVPICCLCIASASQSPDLDEFVPSATAAAAAGIIAFGCFVLCSVGGRGKDGAPIITFPEYSGFSEVPEEDFLNVTTYLTSIPRYPHTPSPEERCMWVFLHNKRRHVKLSQEHFVSLISCLYSLDAASIGFIIVIDRRKDKWSSVKASLSRIAVSSSKTTTCKCMNATSLWHFAFAPH